MFFVYSLSLSPKQCLRPFGYTATPHFNSTVNTSSLLIVWFRIVKCYECWQLSSMGEIGQRAHNPDKNRVSEHFYLGGRVFLRSRTLSPIFLAKRWRKVEIFIRKTPKNCRLMIIIAPPSSEELFEPLSRFVSHMAGRHI